MPGIDEPKMGLCGDPTLSQDEQPDAKDRLAQINPHYFDRCNYFCEFKSASRKDIELLAKEIMDQYRKPFNTDTIAGLTGIETKTVRQPIRTMLTNQGIKCILVQDKLYVCRNRYQSQVGFKQKGKWNYSTMLAEEILNMLGTYIQPGIMGKMRIESGLNQSRG